MNKEINKIFEQWRQFLSWCYENNDKTTEIHRDNLERVMAYTRQLENIIKEVREYIKDNAYWGEETEDGDFVSGKLLHDDDITYIEEILNKGENND